MRRVIFFSITSAVAGVITGIFGSGGGLIVVPLLSILLGNNTDFFYLSLFMMFPIIVVSYLSLDMYTPFAISFPYLIGSALGGLAAFPLQKYIPGKYLHVLLGLLILWGGIRYLCFGS